MITHVEKHCSHHPKILMHSCVRLVFQFKPHPELLALIRLHFPFVSSTFRAQPQRGKVTNAGFACSVFSVAAPLVWGEGALHGIARRPLPSGLLPSSPHPQPIRNKTTPPSPTTTTNKQTKNPKPNKPQKLQTHRLHDYVTGCPCSVFHVLLCGDLEETEPT